MSEADFQSKTVRAWDQNNAIFAATAERRKQLQYRYINHAFTYKHLSNKKQFTQYVLNQKHISKTQFGYSND